MGMILVVAIERAYLTLREDACFGFTRLKRQVPNSTEGLPSSEKSG
jgi:hypothetical protein